MAAKGIEQSSSAANTAGKLCVRKLNMINFLLFQKISFTRMPAGRAKEPCCLEHAAAAEPDPQHVHREKLTTELWAMRRRGDFCDVNVRVQGRAVKCHKARVIDIKIIQK